MRILTILLTITLTTATFAADEDTLTSPATYQQPVLLTSVGQAADVLIMKGLCKRAGIEVTLQKLATVDSLEGFKTVILVAGGSSKGLGAAKGSVDGEKDRINDLIEAAKKATIPVLTFHIGGEPRRGALSDPFNKQAAQAAELIVVTADGDKDDLFRKIADKNKAKYMHIEKSFNAIEVLKELFQHSGTND